MTSQSSPDIVALADEIEDSYSGNFVQDILLDEKDRKLIVAALRARSSAGSAIPCRNPECNCLKYCAAEHGLTPDVAQASAGRVRAALEFYANPKRYDGPNMPPIPGDPFQPEELVYRLDVTRDGGQIARKALSGGAAQPPRQPAEAEKRLVPVHVMGRTRSPSNLPNNSCTGWAPHEPDEATLPLPSTDREPPDYGYCLCGRHRDDQCDYCVSLSSPDRGSSEQ